MSKGTRLYAAWLLALASMLGSLYFSEVRHLVPCVMCWYQRTFMYPLVVILGIASFRRELAIRRYVLPLSGLGMLVAFYQVLEQRIPGLGVPGVCQLTVPCNVIHVNWLGFITLPLLSLAAFGMITLLLAVSRPQVTQRRSEAVRGDGPAPNVKRRSEHRRASR
ncbi:MAG: disulfide oxidoreductase [Deinococcales bacterium]